jgi:hypothetical protein
LRVSKAGFAAGALVVGSQGAAVAAGGRGARLPSPLPLAGVLALRCGERVGMVMRGPLRVDSAKRRPGAADGSSAQSLKRPSMPREASRLG